MLLIRLLIYSEYLYTAVMHQSIWEELRIQVAWHFRSFVLVACYWNQFQAHKASAQSAQPLASRGLRCQLIQNIRSLREGRRQVSIVLTSGVRIVDVAACSNVLILAPQGSFDFCDMKHKQQHCDGDTFVMLSSRKDLAVCCRDYFPFALSKIPTKEYILYIHTSYIH